MRFLMTNKQLFFFQAEDGIRDAQESRGLGDVYKRQLIIHIGSPDSATTPASYQKTLLIWSG